VAIITDARVNIQEEDVQFRSSVSEAVGNKLGGSINFVNNRQFDKHSWHLNGDFSVVTLADVNDGVFVCQEDMEIVGYALYIDTNGTTDGPIIVDLHWRLTDGTDNGTIFTTRPEIAISASDNSCTHSNTRATSNELPTGHTLGVFSKTEFDRHDLIKLELDQTSGGSQGLQLTIFFRPR